jgi:NAD(P)-dependent dehydrogenase (short-subunit alcohol dehydrogenase family)
MDFMERLFDVSGKVAIVTGGGGALGGLMARGLGHVGVRVCVLDLYQDRAEAVADQIVDRGGEAVALGASVLDKAQLETVRDTIVERWGGIDILLNAAGGNVAAATLSLDNTIFDLPIEAFRQVFDLNLLGTVLPSQVFGKAMAADKSGVIVNISSMTAQRAITRVVGYSAAKAAVENFTRWMAMELALKYGSGMRVNALSPGFFIGEQNRTLLLNEDGSLTERGKQIVSHTPMGRFGEAEELVGTLIWLCSDASRFVTGVVVPVDGGFSIFSGV